ncbi:DUF3164 family protein [Cypionkella psychrotolerans]|uniref:DUF3164 family protein n=1 Tax=Cypionkella psychrotolerans TaxID=1678131 RepID=UPI0006B5398B|nr:DUF3164 family protein [Cypionkella psychrotolerans]
MSAFTPAEIPNGRRVVNGTEEIADAKGGWTPVSLVKPQHLLEDEMVRRELGFATALSDQIARFKGHTFENVGNFEALLAQQYGATIGGKKGNKTLMTHDGLFKMSIQVADNIVFGPELQIAKQLTDECLNEWAEGARDEIRAIVTRAFNTDKAGQINRSEIFMLLRLDITDPRWVRAMDAIRDAMRVEGSTTYVRYYRRERHDAPWQAVTLDLAKA